MNKAQDISASYIIGKPRQVSLFRNGANQAIRIPKEFELPGKEALLYRDGNKLVLEAIITEPERGSPAALAQALQTMANWTPLTDDFPDVDAGLLPLDDVRFDDAT